MAPRRLHAVRPRAPVHHEAVMPVARRLGVGEDVLARHRPVVAGGVQPVAQLGLARQLVGLAPRRRHLAVVQIGRLGEVRVPGQRRGRRERAELALQHIEIGAEIGQGPGRVGILGQTRRLVADDPVELAARIQPESVDPLQRILLESARRRHDPAPPRLASSPEAHPARAGFRLD